MCLSWGTVDIALFDCVLGDGPCPSEVITLYEENVRVAHGVWGLCLADWDVSSFGSGSKESEH